MSVSLLLFGSFAICLILSVPVGVSLGISSLIVILVWGKVPLFVLTQSLVIAVDSFPILAVPLFIFAGDLMGAGGCF